MRSTQSTASTLGSRGSPYCLHPFTHAAAAGIVAGEGHDVGAAIFPQQRGEFGRAHLRVVDGIGDHPLPVVADAEPFGGVAPGFRRDLHQADRIGRRLVALVERAFGARHRIDDAAARFRGRSDCAAVCRWSGRRKGRAPGRGRAPSCRSAAWRAHRCGGPSARRARPAAHMSALCSARSVAKLRHDVALAERIEHVGGAHDVRPNSALAATGSAGSGGRSSIRSRPSLARASCP